MAPFFQGLDDGEEFPVVNVIVSFFQGEGGRMIGTGVEIPIGILCMSTPPVAVREESVMMKNSLVVSGILITGTERNVSLSLMNMLSCSFPHWKMIPFFIKSWRGRMRVEKLGMNFQ